MKITTEQLLLNAFEHLDRAQGDVDFDFSGRLAQQSIAYSLIVIADSLHKINERQERIQERKERTKEVW
jgi:hypothetical protein